jgi:hypothetical protein
MRVQFGPVGFYQHPKGLGVTLLGSHDQGVAVTALPRLDLHGRQRTARPSCATCSDHSLSECYDDFAGALALEAARTKFISAEPLLGPIDLGFDHECGDPPHYPCPPMFAKYSWTGRTIKNHRAQIRGVYGTRGPTEADEERWAQWLADEITVELFGAVLLRVRFSGGADRRR